MKTRPYLVTVFLALLILLASAVVVAKNREFAAKLSGNNEVPIRVTGAKGEAEMKVQKQGDRIRFKLEVEDVKNLWMAHFHLGAAGTNGPIVVWLLPRQGPAPAQSIPGESDGKIAQGEITAADLVGPLAGQPLSALIDAIDAGNIYVNVHTNDFVDPPNTGAGDFPGGEIRGQVHEH